MNLLERVQHIQSYLVALNENEKKAFNKLLKDAFKSEGKLSLAEIKRNMDYVLTMFDYDTDLCEDLQPEAPFDYDYFFLSYEDFKEAINHCKDPDADAIIHNLVWIRVNNIKEVLIAAI